MSANNVLDINRIRNQVGREVSIERSEGFQRAGREAEADVAVGADQHHATCRNTGARRVDIGIMRDVHQLGPTVGLQDPLCLILREAAFEPIAGSHGDKNRAR